MRPVMYPDLSVFSNAFFQSEDLPVVHLLGPDPGSLTMRDAARQIERWQTQALTLALFSAWKVRNGYQLEKKLLAEDPDLDVLNDRPRLFHRMASKGEPAVARELMRTDSTSAKWIRRAMSKAPDAQNVMTEPTWRLLDPKPMSHIEWHQAAEAIQPRAVAKLDELEEFEAWVVGVPIDQACRDDLQYFIPRSNGSSRWGLLLTLLQLRRWEVHGDLIAYYLQLLELIARCGTARLDPDFSFMLPVLKNYLTVCFGRVHVGPTFSGNVEYQLARLLMARRAFIAVRGDVASPEPTIVLA